MAYNSDGGLMDYYGQLVQDNVVAKNPNVIAVLNGHYHGASYETTVFDDDGDGVYDRTVYQICTDYQSGFEGGNGYIKMLYFDLDNNKIYINSYSPSINDYNYYDNATVTELGTENPASIPADTADGRAAPKRINNNINTDILTLNVSFHTDPQTLLTNYFGAYLNRGEEIGTADFVVAQDSTAQSGSAALTWDDLQPGTEYAWYAVVQNTLGSVQQTAAQTFTTAAVPAAEPSKPGNTTPEPDPGPNPGSTADNTSTGSNTSGTANHQTANSQSAVQTAAASKAPAAAKTFIPQTSDSMPIVAICLVCLGSLTALVLLTIYRKKRKED